jgi:hypothetical protein
MHGESSPFSIQGVQDAFAKVAREHLIEGFCEKAELEGGLLPVVLVVLQQAIEAHACTGQPHPNLSTNHRGITHTNLVYKGKPGNTRRSTT